MQNPSEQQASKSDLLVHWLVFACLLCSLAVYIVIGHIAGGSVQAAGSTGEPVLLRSVFYALSIITFPLIQLLRHISLRLNQTMPTPTPAKSRYLITVLISLALAETMGIYGLILALLGDSINSLWILSFMSLLAMLLFRPKYDEYEQILSALNSGPRQRANVR